jgi:hypothetical protein
MAGTYACIAAGAVIGIVGCAMMCSEKSMRMMKKKACRAAHRVSDFVVDNIHSLM